LDAEEKFGVRQEELLSEPEDPSVVVRDRERFEGWSKHHSETVSRASVETFTVWRASDRVPEIGSDAPVSIVELGARPHLGGSRFGSLVHAILATADLDADEAGLRAAAGSHGRSFGASDSEIADAQTLVQAALTHPLMRRAAAAFARGQCRREAPLTWRASNGSLVEGVADLAFEEAAGWTVVDFKTDHDLAKGLDTYRDQVRLYARAVADATGRPAQAVLLKL
jgi:ATP-dependent exoDNAse (exonuclease V) beta subunit